MHVESSPPVDSVAPPRPLPVVIRRLIRVQPRVGQGHHRVALPDELPLLPTPGPRREDVHLEQGRWPFHQSFRVPHLFLQRLLIRRHRRQVPLLPLQRALLLLILEVLGGLGGLVRHVGVGEPDHVVMQRGGGVERQVGGGDGAPGPPGLGQQRPPPRRGVAHVVPVAIFTEEEAVAVVLELPPGPVGREVERGVDLGARRAAGEEAGALVVEVVDEDAGQGVREHVRAQQPEAVDAPARGQAAQRDAAEDFGEQVIGEQIHGCPRRRSMQPKGILVASGLRPAAGVTDGSSGVCLVDLSVASGLDRTLASGLGAGPAQVSFRGTQVHEIVVGFFSSMANDSSKFVIVIFIHGYRHPLRSTTVYSFGHFIM